MERTFVEKLLGASRGSIVVREPALVMSHDNTARVVRLFERMEGTRVFDPSRVVMVLDGKVAGLTAEVETDRATARAFAEEQGVERFYEAGTAICHEAMASLVRPGMLVVGSDTRTPTAGAFNCLALSMNKTETAVAWKTGRVWTRVPETIKVVLRGRMQEGVTAKDLALWVMGVLRGLDVNGQFIEYHGDGVATLTVDERMTVANISSEAGVVGAVFPPDDVLADYYGEPAVRGVWADAGASYARFIDIDLGRVFPLVYDTTAAATRGVNELEGMEVGRGLIGGCATGRLSDLRAVADVLDGDTVAPGFQLYIVPGSREIYWQAVEEGVVDRLTRAGAIVLTSSCGPCLGLGYLTAATSRRLLTTINSRFAGGETDVEKYVASPITVAKTALRGCLATPVSVEGAVFENRPLPAVHARLEEHDYRRVNGVWNYADIDHISADQLFSSRLAYRMSYHDGERLRPRLLEGLDGNFARDARPGDMMVVGENFGWGRPAKHAVLGLLAVGLRLIVAKSVSRDFFRLAMNHGLRVLIDWELVKNYTSRDRLRVDWSAGLVYVNDTPRPLPQEDPEFTDMMEKGGLLKAFV